MGRPISKTTKFILALPQTLSAKEVLARAKASGHRTSEGNIYRVRRLHGRNKATAKKTSTATRTVATEDLLRAVAAELGLGQAMEILQRERAQVIAVLGGYR